MLVTRYKLSEEDYLIDFLFNDSKSKTLKNKRRKAVYGFTALFVALGIYTLVISEFWVGACCLLMALFYFFLYPIKLKNTVVQMYAKTTAERYADRFNRLEEVAFDEFFFYCSRNEQEAKINLSSFEALYEIKNYYFLKNKNGNSYIIPKYKLTDAEAVKAELMKLVETQKLRYEVDLDWKYRVI